MNSISSLCSPLLPPRPSSSLRPQKMGFRRRRKVSVVAEKRDACDWDFGGRLVDESMIVLRRRIHEKKMVERNYEPPMDWMEWEKKYYTSYDASICKAVGVLQSLLMNTRPSLALGMVALVALSVPTSMVLVMLHLMNGIHLLN
ncbi:uncharacterized protein LOC122080982 [Macadamia integrifolia]|uniref:uncharacterized protein LOC122080982 n=1 Tax=Macadamia integrifolia TaxID=60698 RepID=UPI001C4F4ECD|nr:uncharacterized protein LOC122080982 [Macadamia integrifolia]